MKLPEYRNEPHFIQWCVMWHLTRDYSEFLVARQYAKRGALDLADYVEQMALDGKPELSLAADVLRFSLSLVDWNKAAADVLEVQAYD